MLSPADPARGAARRAFEAATFAAALGLLLWLLIRSVSGSGAGPEERVTSATLPAALARWSTIDGVSRVGVVVDGDVSPFALDWLAALRKSGTPAAWEGAPAALAAVNDPIADPSGGTRIQVATAAGTPIALDDRFGPLDSVTTGQSGARFVARSGPQWIRARTGRLAARASTPDSLGFGRLLLLARVGWESKFVAAALEERGWQVDARLALSPRGDVAPAGAARLDTSRYSAVIVLDSLAPADLTAVGPYIRSGGGAIIAAPALRAPLLAGLGAVRAAPLRAAESFDTAATDPRGSLGLIPIADRPGQLTLESRDQWSAVVARRIERGRLVILGYQDTWRWRMAGRADGAERHREWWAGLVSSVARVRRLPRPDAGDNVDEAPLAHLVEALGPAAASGMPGASGRAIPDGWLFGFMLGFALLAWTSRRLRGAP